MFTTIQIKRNIYSYVDYVFEGFVHTDNKINPFNKQKIYYEILGYLDSLFDFGIIDYELYEEITDKIESFVSYNNFGN